MHDFKPILRSVNFSQVWMQRTTALIVLLAVTPTQPARAGFWDDLVYVWRYGDQMSETQRPGRRPRELAGIPINPLSRDGLAYLNSLGGLVDEAGWYSAPFPSVTAFGVDMAPGRYQMQADWDRELSILIDVNDRGLIVWMGFYFYPYYLYQ